MEENRNMPWIEEKDDFVIYHTETYYDEDGNLKDGAEQSTPVSDVIIKTVKVEKFDSKYDFPQTLDVWDYYNWIYKTYGIDMNAYK